MVISYSSGLFSFHFWAISLKLCFFFPKVNYYLGLCMSQEQFTFIWLLLLWWKLGKAILFKMTCYCYGWILRKSHWLVTRIVFSSLMHHCICICYILIKSDNDLSLEMNHKCRRYAAIASSGLLVSPDVGTSYRCVCYQSRCVVEGSWWRSCAGQPA